MHIKLFSGYWCLSSYCKEVFFLVYLFFLQGSATDRTDTFELCYNYACLLIAKGDLDGAQAKLEKAEGKFSSLANIPVAIRFSPLMRICHPISVLPICLMNSLSF